ncbi:hypothetical protein QBC35DRAFT_477882 [Podospora australis]|uniref:Uncharacterized protein n=1 Tax=Podospora australis TaxID=1536484 RepID=A0AAN6WKJ6_9PEZI|nr:hypothetical protein QBC35DRAFT_477882 [Podospora australis]
MYSFRPRHWACYPHIVGEDPLRIDNDFAPCRRPLLRVPHRLACRRSSSELPGETSSLGPPGPLPLLPLPLLLLPTPPSPAGGPPRGPGPSRPREAFVREDGTLHPIGAKALIQSSERAASVEAISADLDEWVQTFWESHAEHGLADDGEEVECWCGEVSTRRLDDLAILAANGDFVTIQDLVTAVSPYLARHRDDILLSRELAGHGWADLVVVLRDAAPLFCPRVVLEADDPLDEDEAWATSFSHQSSAAASSLVAPTSPSVSGPASPQQLAVLSDADVAASARLILELLGPALVAFLASQ